MPGYGLTSKGINYDIMRERGPHGHASQPHLSVLNKGGRTGRQIGGRANLLEEVGRLDAERMNPNRRAEKSRVIGELNRGYNKGGRVGLQFGGRAALKAGGDCKWIQKVNKSIKARGTKGKCTPITKPGCTGRAKALAKTFKKIAAKRKA